MTHHASVTISGFDWHGFSQYPPRLYLFEDWPGRSRSMLELPHSGLSNMVLHREAMDHPVSRKSANTPEDSRLDSDHLIKGFVY